MALTLGRALSLALRKANADYIETQRLAGGLVSLPAGDIEHGIDLATTHKFTVNGHDMYVPHDVVTANPNFELAGQVGGGAYTCAGQPGATSLPTTTLYLYPSSDSETVYIQDWHTFYLRAEVNRTRVTTVRNLYLDCQARPDATTYPAYVTGDPPPSRESDSCFIRHTCTNDFATVDMRGQPGDIINLVNIHVLPGAGWVGLLTTSSGAYSQINVTDCTIRGYIGCVFMFGAGASALQDGKRSTWTRVKFVSAYCQGPGPEVANRGGNGDYNHPVVGANFYFCEFGDPTGSTTEAIYERGLYFNGGTTGYAPDHFIEDCVFHENCYEGIKIQSGNRPDGNPGRFYIRRCTVRSLKWSITNDDGDVLVTDSTFTGGQLSSGYHPENALKRLTLQDCVITANYARPPSQYEGGNDDTQDDVVNGSVTLIRTPITWTGGRHATQSSTGCNLIVQDSTITAVGTGAASYAVYLGAAGGISAWSNVVASGQTRPFYLQRPDVDNAHVFDNCDFSACTVGFRVTFDQDGNTPGFGDNAYRTVVKDTTKLPDATPTISGTRPQRWKFYAGDRAATVASASTITAWQSSDRDTVTGSSTINTINACGSSSANMLFDDAYRAFRVGPTASWKFGTSGNITPLNTNARTPGDIVMLRYSVASTKWVEVVDPLAPVFGGVTGFSIDAASRGTITWSAARDMGTETATIRYRVYVATGSGEQNFASPTTTVTGVTTVDLPGLLPAVYFVVVRAVDTFGNEDTNVVELSAQTVNLGPLIATGPAGSGQGPLIEDSASSSATGPLISASPSNPSTGPLIVP